MELISQVLLFSIVVFLIYHIYETWYNDTSRILANENTIWDTTIDGKKRIRKIYSTWNKMNNTAKHSNNDSFVYDRIDGYRQNIKDTFRIDLPLHPDAKKQRDNVQKKILKKALKVNGPKAAKVLNYMENSKTNTSDPQNVHDRSVTLQTKEIYNKIKRDEYRYLMHDSWDDILFAVRGHPNSRKIYYVLDEIKKNEISIIPLNEREDEIITTIWNRHNHPENKKKQIEMKSAFIDALLDCYKPNSNKLECATGRIIRVIGGLATIDFDPIMGQIQTREMHKNEVFAHANHILKKKLHEYKNSTDPMRRKWADVFVMEDINKADKFEQQVPYDVKHDFRESYRRDMEKFIQKKGKLVNKNIINDVMAWVDY
jgi:hypothetical protein